MELKEWFKGFENGITQLSADNRNRLFSECAKNCVESCVLKIYKKMYDESHGNLDDFFNKVNDLPGVRSDIVKPGHTYHLIFKECTCGLCNTGLVTTPLFCECSRQSVIYSMNKLWKKHIFNVTLCHSILQGAQDCKIKIEVIK